MSKDTPIQKIKVAGEFYVLMPFDEYLALSQAAKALSKQFLEPSDAIDLTADARDLPKATNKLKAWRKLRGLTQHELASLAGISGPFLTLIETGKRRGAVEIWRSLARALNVTLEEILPDS